ncbi:MAG: outer membrane beta-barrel protein [Devosia sp.]
MKSKVLLGAVVAALLSSTGVMAADLAMPAAAVLAPVPAANDWTGFYLGVFGGLGASSHDFGIVTPGPTANATISGNGGFGGIQGGYNFDLGGAVLGVSADLALANIGASVNVTGIGPGSINASSTIDYFGTVQGRVGLPVDNLLIYAHGGYAYAHEKQTVTGLGPAINFDQGHSGYVIGAGIDYAINQNLSLETEYSYYGLGSATIASGILGAGTSLNETTSFHALKVGLNYKF